MSADVEILIFPQVSLFHERGTDYSSEDNLPSVDLFLHGNWDKFRFVSEYFWSEEEHHFERFQISYNPGEQSEFSLGRFHTPFGYWHTEYHHGSYLQPTITRPSIDEFGADGGIIPGHMLGLMYEHTLQKNEAGYELIFAAGLGPEIDAEGGGHHGAHGGATLHDAEIFDFERDAHENMYAIKFAYKPDEFANDQWGGHYIQADIKLDSTEHHHIELEVIGVFANLEYEAIKLLTSAYHIETRFSGGSHEEEKGRFTSAYVQVGHNMNEKWLLWGRLEDSVNDQHDIYLETLTGFIPERQAIGLRYDFYSNQALKFEWLVNHREDETEKLFLIEWSAVLP